MIVPILVVLSVAALAAAVTLALRRRGARRAAAREDVALAIRRAAPEIYARLLYACGRRHVAGAGLPAPESFDGLPPEMRLTMIWWAAERLRTRTP